MLFKKIDVKPRDVIDSIESIFSGVIFSEESDFGVIYVSGPQKNCLLKKKKPGFFKFNKQIITCLVARSMFYVKQMF